MLALLNLDAVNPRLLEGLPNVEALAREARRHELVSPATHFPAGTYATLYTGADVGQHGSYYTVQWDAARQRVVPGEEVPLPPAVWERAASAGHPVLVVDPYEGRQPGELDGLYVSGWQLRNRIVLPTASTPREAYRLLRRRHGVAPVVDEVFGRPTVELLRSFRRRLVAAPGRVADLVEQQLRSRRFALVWATFVSTHIGGHQFWDLSQLSERDRVTAEREGLGNALREIYEAADAALGRVLAALPDDADVIVFSAQGMDVNTSRVDLLAGMLDAVLTGSADEGSPGGWLWSFRARVPTSWRARVAAALPRRAVLEVASRLETRGVDWTHVRAFALPSDALGYIRLNVRGRERLGIVDPADAPALCEEIAHGLLAFRDPDGGPAVAAVEPIDDVFPGVRSDLLPDLIVHWARTHANLLDHVESPAVGVVRRRGAGSGRSGNHTPDAWALVAARSSVHREPRRPPRVTDLAATVADVLELGGDGGGEPLLTRS